MDVKFKDRKEHIELMRGAINMVGLGIDYKSTILLLQAQEKLAELGGKFTLKDAHQLQAEWSDQMEKYYDSLEKEVDNG